MRHNSADECQKGQYEQLHLGHAAQPPALHHFSYTWTSQSFQSRFSEGHAESGYALLGVSSEHIRPSGWPVSGSHSSTW